MSTDHLYKTVVEESDGDVTSDMPRSLVTETTSVEISKTTKPSKTHKR
jgi:hypothetical protein